MFDVYFLNFGAFNGKLFGHNYVSLDATQVGGAGNWARYILRYLKTLTDELVIFALDDYFLSGPINMLRYALLENRITDYEDIICARLCSNAFYTPNEYEPLDDDLLVLTNKANYSATTQYCIWRREALVRLLEMVYDPWQFEILGSQFLNATGKKVIGSVIPALDYPDCSALSSKWNNRVRVRDNRPNDIAFLIEQGYLHKEDLV
jgi:hypothetical protein